MSDSNVSEVRWRKSRYSGGNGGSCVEVAGLADGRIAVRDSKNIGPVVTSADADWRSFLGGLKSRGLEGEGGME
ncbi:DUF397 domain-containing protein [Sphaerisporangium dianthi]|uniref:DUF397 domain-containing protein n=1 Tax=Sphaerisporangium dianthi TaxID=1436120 RepID=A0ABV9CQT9_9ACTN